MTSTNNYSGLTELYRVVGYSSAGYQEEGVGWMVCREGSGGGGVLADEMGLGKTIQILGLICTNVVEHTLIVLPRALLEQWKTTIKKTMNHTALIYHNSGPININKITSHTLSKSPIVLTTYGMLNSYLLQNTSWDRIVFDEAHHLRNSKNKTFKLAHNIKSPIKWLVTGTPIQNKRQDFYSLCRILRIPENIYTNPDNLATIAKDFILKRTKKQVGIQLPHLQQDIISVTWDSNTERELSQDIHHNLSFSNISNSSGLLDPIYSSPLPFLTYARQSCILPSLLLQRFSQLFDDDIPDDILLGLQGSSKMDAVLNLILSRKDNLNSKIIFCHYLGEIDYIKSKLSKHNLIVHAFDGRVSQSQREKILTNHCDVLILQIKTGCEGLNLQHFSEVYFITPHWNPAIEDQAVARCHRIGQTKPVHVFRFNMDNLNDHDEHPITIDLYAQSVQDKKRTIMQELE